MILFLSALGDWTANKEDGRLFQAGVKRDNTFCSECLNLGWVRIIGDCVNVLQREEEK